MRLLVVEDDPLLRERLKKDLSQAGFAVDVADNGVDAEFMGQEEPYDAVVLDLGLPKRAGLEVLRNWRRLGKATPVVVLTARDAWHEKVDGFKTGADDYLGKPFHIEEHITHHKTKKHHNQNQNNNNHDEARQKHNEERQ